MGTKGTVKCPPNYQLITDPVKCRDQVPKWAGKPASNNFVGCWKFAAVGCFANANNIAFTKCKHAQTNPAHIPVCERVAGINFIYCSISLVELDFDRELNTPFEILVPLKR